MLFATHALEPALAAECTRKCYFVRLELEVSRRCSANTMSSCLEVLGLSLPYSATIPATYPG